MDDVANVAIGVILAQVVLMTEMIEYGPVS